MVDHRSKRKVQLTNSPQTVISTPDDEPSPLFLSKPLESDFSGDDIDFTCRRADSNVAALQTALLLAAGVIATKIVCSMRDLLSSADVMPVQDLAAITVAGFFAQLVDGSLGMGYGMTSSTVLVAAGVSPAAASTSVHLAQLGTTFLSGLAHHRFGNVDAGALVRLAPAGMLGALGGAALLSSLPTKAAKPIASGLLFALGAYVLARFYLGKAHRLRAGAPGLRLLAPLGFAGGFVDATGGGGWGPVATSGLLADGRLRPRLAIGTVSAAEFFVTVAAVLGFGLASLCGAAGNEAAGGVRAEIVLTLLVGGLLAAPIAPLLVGGLKPQLLGVVVGGFIMFTNARGLLVAANASPRGFWSFYAAILAVWGTAVARVASI